MKDYYVLFTSDCCATYSQAQHDATLFNIDQFFGQVVTSDEIMACWPAAETKLSAWEQYAQVLFLGNEFAFVD